MDGYPEEWEYDKRLRIVVSADERKVDMLKHVKEFKVTKTNEAVQMIDKEIQEKKDNKEASAAQQVQVSSTGVVQRVGGA